MTTEAYIFDAVRTPRGRGKKDGSLHSVKPISLLTTVLHALQERNSLDTAQVDDIVMGCVTAVGDQGADIAKTAKKAAGKTSRAGKKSISSRPPATPEGGKRTKGSTGTMTVNQYRQWLKTVNQKKKK